MEKPQGWVGAALKRTHAALVEDLRKLEEVARHATEEDLTQLQDRLTATQQHVADHFRFEEQNGYMEAVVEREPRLERAVQQLALEHIGLRDSLNALIADARMVTRIDEAYWQKLQK